MALGTACASVSEVLNPYIHRDHLGPEQTGTAPVNISDFYAQEVTNCHNWAKGPSSNSPPSIFQIQLLCIPSEVHIGIKPC